MSWIQIIGLIGALLLGIYNAYRDWDERNEYHSQVPAVESELPDASVIPESRGEVKALRFGP